MTRFFGKVGFIDPDPIDDGSGKFIDEVTEREYFGDVKRNALRAEPKESSVNDDLVLDNTIEIVADDHARDNISMIAYVRWGGGLWSVTSVEDRAPRLVLRLGGVYNGFTP